MQKKGTSTRDFGPRMPLSARSIRKSEVSARFQADQVRTAQDNPSDAHRTMEARLRSALARAKSLIHEKDAVIHNLTVARQEADHRLLNNLQMVVGLLGSQSRMARNAEVASQLSIAADRVGAIARIHRHLRWMDGEDLIDFNQYLQDI